MLGGQRLTLEIDGLPRQFLLHHPSATAPNLPLIIMLHGTGGTAAWAEEETGWSTLADQEGFAVVYPEALPPDPDKAAKFLTNPPTWHDGSIPDDPHGQAADLNFLNQMLDFLQERYSIDPEQTFLTGFSNGAGMTFRWSAASPERFAATAPVAGHCWNDERPISKPLPTLYMVGDADPLVPLQGGAVRTPWRLTRSRPSVPETLNRWARIIGALPPPRRSIEHDVIRESFCNAAGETLLESLILKGLGHHWPGGQGRLSADVGGPYHPTIDGCQTIWRFFQSARARRSNPSSVETSGS